MARLKTEHLYYEQNTEKINFKVTINITSEGEFTTMIPPEMVKYLEIRNATIRTNRIGNKGYYSDKSLKALLKQIKLDFDEAMSMKQVSDKIVIRYNVATYVSYCLNGSEIVPNGGWVENGDYQWKQGSVNFSSYNRHPFGLMFYVDVKKRKTYELRSGKIITKYEKVFDGNFNRAKPNDKQFYLKWIDGLPVMSMPKNGVLIEVDYTEERAKLFVDMVKGVIKMSEQLAGLQTTEGLLKIVENKKKLMN